MKSDNAEKISDEDKKVIDEAVEEAKKTASKEDADKDELEAAGKALTDKIMPIGAKMYESAAKADEDPTEASAKEDKEQDDKDPKGKDKEEGPVEGEIVDEK